METAKKLLKVNVKNGKRGMTSDVFRCYEKRKS